LLEILSHPVNLCGHNIHVTSSIGIAVYPEDGIDSEILLKSAEAAMYHAKRAGKNVYHFYDQGMNETALKRMSVENELRQALARTELKLVYQPQVDLTSDSICGVEALLRWHNPQLGVVSPLEFIPLAEESGLIIPIGEWVLQNACEQAKVWQAQGLPPIRVAVNLSTRQFMHPDLPGLVAEVLGATGLDAQHLELEITESLLMEDVQQAIETMDTLKSMGVWLAIDDFGTGYSSLSYLKRFPIDRLKIDRSFVSDISHDPDSAAIALAIVSMAHNLNLGVVAEGVETEAQQLFLKDRLCDEAQGFLFSCPLPPTELGSLLDRQRSEELLANGDTSTIQSFQLAKE
jgi:EAL domain-containing protein (putative c-di-GMP-specific phosphodiesterase class I)